MNPDRTDFENRIMNALSCCRLCGRNCKIDRIDGKTGFCGQTDKIRAARAALHFWEEPVISGTHGSGAVFFSGCNLRCVFCQNAPIANSDFGMEITSERLTDIFFELKEQGANNINLVTGTPFIPQIVIAITRAKDRGFDLPFIFNCGGYESVEAIKMLDGLIDIYLPDLKYYSSELSLKYSYAPDYFEKACAALDEMYRQVGAPAFMKETKDSPDDTLLKKGMIVRHLLLPGQTKDSKKILRYLRETFGDNIYISIMNQYTPMPFLTEGSNAGCKYPELARKVTPGEYARVVDFAIKIGIEKAFIQEGETAEESFIPSFDYTGLIPKDGQ